MSEFTRPRHRLVARVLARLDAGFLASAQSYFGGGTRISMALGEFRDSAEIDILCASRDGYRELRSTVSARSLGRIAGSPIPLAREVIADRYGIRTFLELDGEKIKFEIVSEGRIDIEGPTGHGFPLAVLSRADCFAEKLLANADRWNDESVCGRDVIDLAFMIIKWPREDAAAGADRARVAYGKIVDGALKKAVTAMQERKPWAKRCVTALAITDPWRAGCVRWRRAIARSIGANDAGGRDSIEAGESARVTVNPKIYVLNYA